MIAENQDGHREGETESAVSEKIGNEHENGIDRQRGFRILGDVDRCPLQSVPRRGNKESEHGGIDPVAPVDFLIGITRVAEERDHGHDQRIFNDRSEHERRHDCHKDAAESAAERNPKIKFREMPCARPA